MIPILNSNEAKGFAEKVYALKSHWIPHGRDPQFPYFYTLGLGLYLDPIDGAKYLTVAQTTNHILKENFSELYKLIINVLTDILQAPIILTKTGAIPGFHIYGLPMPNGGSIHQDGQHLSYIRMYPDDWDASELYSFTVCLDLPATGGGIRIWEAPPGTGLDTPTKDTPNVKVEYRVGSMLLLPSLMFHQIAPNPDMKPGDRRTTLQGHLLRHRDGHWVMYW